MSQQLALFHFSLPALQVEGELLGAIYYFERGNFGVLLTIPESDDDFGYAIKESVDGGLVQVYKSGPGRQKALKAEVYVIQVAVALESIASSESDTAEGRQAGSRALATGLEVAVKVAEDFVAWLRTEVGQYWLGQSHEHVALLRFDLVDAEHGGTVPNVSIPQDLTFYFGRDRPVRAAEMNTVVGHLAAEEEVSVANILLADARSAVATPLIRAEWKEDRRDTARAVLLAAIASEVKIKRTLVDKAAPDRRKLADIIASNPRDITIAAATLVHKPMKAAIGRSLHEDDPALFKAVENLFSIRNRLAHDARRPTVADADKAVDTAVKLAHWLDHLDPAP